MGENITRVIALISMLVGISAVILGLEKSDLFSDFAISSEYMYLFFGIFYLCTGTFFAVFSSDISAFMRIISGRRRVALFHLPNETNRKYIENLANELEVKGVSVWIDFDEIKAGDNILKTIKHEIANADAVVFVFDGPEFKFLELFLGYAIAAETRIVPISVNGVKIPREISELSHVNSVGNPAEDAIKVLEGVRRAKPRMLSERKRKISG